MDEILKSLAILVAAVGGSGAILMGVAAFIGKWWIDRIYLRTQASYEQKLEEIRDRSARQIEQLRSEIAERQRVLNATHDVLTRGYEASHEKVVTALEVLWNSFLELQKKYTPILFVYSILLPNEYKDKDVNQIGDGRFAEFFASHKNIDEIWWQTLLMERVEVHRLFIGENLWQIFIMYHGVIGKLVYKLLRSVADTGRIPEWDKGFDGKPDLGIQNALKIVFLEDELQAILGFPNTPQRIMNALETKMLNSMNEIIFGRRLLELSIAEQQKLDLIFNHRTDSTFTTETSQINK